jgi:hypothetical protein
MTTDYRPYARQELCKKPVSQYNQLKVTGTLMVLALSLLLHKLWNNSCGVQYVETEKGMPTVSKAFGRCGTVSEQLWP